MNNISSPDKTMEKVFAGLRETSAPAGLENRVLQRLAGVYTEPPVRWKLWPLRMQAWVIPSAALASAACIAVLIALHPHSSTERDTSSAARVVTGPSHAVTEIEPAHAKPFFVGSARAIRSSHGMTPEASQGLSETDALMQDMLAPSQPAPPIPLTRQEKLLLRAANRVDRDEIAQLEALPPLLHREDPVAQYIHQMLTPLVMAERLNPTPQPEAVSAPVRDEAAETLQPPQ